MNTGGWDDREWLMMKLIISNRYLMLKMLIEIISDYMTYVTKNFGEAEYHVCVYLAIPNGEK